MAENQQDKKTLQKEIKELRTALKKSEDNASKKKEKISALQTELDEIDKEIKNIKGQISEKEALIKKAEYSTVLNKLDNATLNSLSKRQAEQLVKMIESGDISALLDDDTKVDTNINEKSAVATSSNNNIKNVDTNSNVILNKKEGV